MNDQEIIIANKMIAEFMGAKYEAGEFTPPNQGAWSFGYLSCTNTVELCNMRLQYVFSCDFDKLQYHNNWNWLMPVLDKIESNTKKHTTITLSSPISFDIDCNQFRDFGKYECRIDEWEEDPHISTNTYSSTSDKRIDAVYRCVVFYLEIETALGAL